MGEITRDGFGVRATKGGGAVSDEEKLKVESVGRGGTVLLLLTRFWLGGPPKTC
jgi:hypothetical protein